MEQVKWTYNTVNRKEERHVSTEFLNQTEANKALKFHRSFPNYNQTPIHSLTNLAHHLGVSNVFVKDESYRFGLNAFKVLGGAYAVGKYLAKILNMDIQDLSLEFLQTKEAQKKLGQITFASTTDGNHGRGLAWTAQQIGQKAIIYMPKGSAPIRLKHITDTGAEAYITEFNYDDTVRMAAKKAKENGWVFVQDTAWEGYEDIPTWIMQGYSTIALETLQQLKDIGVEKPTHIFLQAGVGSFAASIVGFYTTVFENSHPKTIIVEPNKADCFYLSINSTGKTPQIVSGDMDTIMAGLACGEPNPFAWEILREYSDCFISCPDYIAAEGMRILGNPLGDDSRVISGESGAVTTGILYKIMKDNRLKELRHSLQLNSHSKILMINTEGDTDPDQYRRVVWEGYHPSFN